MQEYQHLAQKTESPIGILTMSRYVPRSNQIYKQMKDIVKALSVFDEHKRSIFYADSGGIITSDATKELRSLHAMLGLLSEMEELVLCYIKSETLDQINLLEELGDIFWYIALLCNANGIEFNQVMERNIAKLQARYPNKFSVEDAIHRDLNAERKVLSQDEQNPFSDLP